MTAHGQRSALHADTASADPATVLAVLADALAHMPPLDASALLLLAHTALARCIEQRDAARQAHEALFDALPDPVSILSAEGVVLDVNHAGVAAYGLPKHAVIGQPIEHLNPDLPTDHLQPVWAALRDRRSYVIETTNMSADGSRFPVEVHSCAFRYQGAACILAIARDLGSRWQVESRYRLLLESIDKGVILFDEQLRIVSANPAAHRILGTHGQVAGMPLATLLDPQQWTVVDEHGHPLPREQWPSNRCLQAGRVVASTTIGLYNRPRGQMLWLSMTNVPLFNSGRDRADHVFAMFSDITELKRTTTLFDRAQSLAHIGGWEWERSLQQLYLTDEARRIFGHGPALTGMPQLLALLRNEDHALLRQALNDTDQAGAAFALELRGQRADGHSFWVRMIGEVDPGDVDAGRITGTVQDITERKQAEETLRVQARTDPLTGVMNRDAVLCDLSERMATPAHCRVGVLYIDLDHFKIINDLLGHSAGDALLVEATERINRAIGTEGLLARLGGDEFLVVCDAHDPTNPPEQVAARIVEAFVAPFVFGSDAFAVTASIGIATAPDDGQQPQQLIHNADAAMYACKRRTRNGWARYTADPSAAVPRPDNA